MSGPMGEGPFPLDAEGNVVPERDDEELVDTGTHWVRRMARSGSHWVELNAGHFLEPAEGDGSKE